MTLQQQHDRFFQGGVDKADYVASMQLIHRQLLDYAAFLPATDIARIEITEGKVVLTCRSTGLKLWYDDPHDQYAVLTLMNFGNYEPLDFALLSGLMARLFHDAPFTFLDIGANMGWYALNLAKRFPAADVHAFEPVPSTFRNLEKNLMVNGFANVTLHNLGLMAAAGELDFFLDPRISGRASARNLVEDPEAQPVSCPVAPMDAFLSSQGIVPDVIKVDVEGAELMVFQGGLETLRTHRPLIMAEMLRKWAAKFGYHPDAVIALLAEAGYRCYFAEGAGLVELTAMTEDVSATNFFFLHRERHAGLLD